MMESREPRLCAGEHCCNWLKPWRYDQRYCTGGKGHCYWMSRWGRMTKAQKKRRNDVSRQYQRKWRRERRAMLKGYDQARIARDVKPMCELEARQVFAAIEELPAPPPVMDWWVE